MWVLAAFVVSCSPQTQDDRCAQTTPKRLSVQVIRELPHNPESFTQGLLVANGRLYESTGRYGESTVQELDLQTGNTLLSTKLDPKYFGEGLAMGPDGKLVQLTWREGAALKWDPAALTPAGLLSYQGEGWGLTTLPSGEFLMSDGSDTLVTRNPATFEQTKSNSIKGYGLLNELDYDGTAVWANQWQSDEILKIDLACSRVDAIADASTLTSRARAVSAKDQQAIDVLNGIASIPGTDRFYVTGKLWPIMYEVRFL